MAEPTFDEARWSDGVERLELASAALTAERIDDAERDARAAAAVLAEVVGPAHPDYANAVALLGSVAWVRGQVRDAEARFREALAIYERFRGDAEDWAVVRPFRVQVLRRLGMLWSLMGAFSEAERALREALGEAAAMHGDDAVETAPLRQALGVCLRFQGRYVEARDAYDRAEALARARGEPEGASYHHNLSGLASAEGDFVTAEAHARRAITLRRAQQGEGAYLGTDLCGLGDALAGQGRHADAESAYREAIALYRRCGCGEHVEVAYAHHNLGDTLSALGRADEAAAAYRESIARKTRAYGGGHYEVAASLNNLAALLAETGRLAEARKASRRAVAIAARAVDEGHPVRRGCEALARALAR